MTKKVSTSIHFENLLAYPEICWKYVLTAFVHVSKVSRECVSKDVKIVWKFMTRVILVIELQMWYIWNTDHLCENVKFCDTMLKMLPQSEICSCHRWCNLFNFMYVGGSFQNDLFWLSTSWRPFWRTVENLTNWPRLVGKIQRCNIQMEIVMLSRSDVCQYQGEGWKSEILFFWMCHNMSRYRLGLFWNVAYRAQVHLSCDLGDHNTCIQSLKKSCT